MRLVADIGGTNARLALCENGVIVPQSVRKFANDDWPHLYDLIMAYLSDFAAPVVEMVIAVAGPIHRGHATLTNRDWTIETSQLSRRFDCPKATLLNDLTALGYAVRDLGQSNLRQIHRGDAYKTGTGQALVVGIGTGFNVSPVIISDSDVRCLRVEAGHAALPQSISQMLGHSVGKTSDFWTVERLFSGQGFSKFCQLSMKNNAIKGADVIASYDRADVQAARLAVNQYAALLGQLLRELSLNYMPNAGIYLAGSVARAIVEKAPRPCVNVFTKQCAIQTESMPSLFTIIDDGAALNGCASFR